MKRRRIRFDKLVPAQNLRQVTPGSPLASRLALTPNEAALTDDATIGTASAVGDQLVVMATMSVRQRPGDMSLRDWAIYLLHNAALIEHALMVQYLYAAYSIDDSANGPDASDPTIAAPVASWPGIISKIAIEEMGHLLTVQNILRFVGGSITFAREDFPIDTEVYPFQFQLEGLTKDVLAKYVYAEMPEGDIPPSVLSPAMRADIEARAKKAATGGGGNFVNHVGTLYATLLDVFADPAFQSPATSGFPPAADANAVTYQARAITPDPASSGFWPHLQGNNTIHDTVNAAGVPQLVSLKGARLLWVNSIGDVLDALSFIARQGEAPDKTAINLSHFARFLSIYKSFPDDGAAGWAKPPAFPVPTNPTSIPEPITPSTISHDLTKLWARLFDVRYRMLLVLLAHATAIPNVGNPSDGSPIDALVNRIFEVMKGSTLLSIGGIAKFLVGMPRTNQSTSENAGAPFTMPYTTAIPNRPRERWQFHLDILDSSDTVIAEIGKQMGKQVPNPNVQAFADADGGLAEMGSLDATWRAQVTAIMVGLKPNDCDNV